MQDTKTALTFESFIEKAQEEVRAGKKFSGLITFCERDVWADFEHVLSHFNSVKRRRWKAYLMETYQDDFSILKLKDTRATEDDKNFFIKVSGTKQYVDLLVFSFEGYEAFRIFKSLINIHTKKAWLGWLGSIFLERFDEVIKAEYPDSNVELVSFNFVSHDNITKKFKGTVINRVPTSKEGLFTLRDSYKTLNQTIYLQKITYEVTGRTGFKISLSDRTEFTLQGGNLLEFLSFFGVILKKAQQERESFIKTRTIKRRESKVKIDEKLIEIVDFEIDKIEIIEIDVDNPVSSDWFKNFASTFSAGYLEEHNLICSAINEGNPYFLAQITDLDNASRIFVSATSRSIRISPGTEQTKPRTMSKLFTILQAQVDSSIGTGRLNGAYSP